MGVYIKDFKIPKDCPICPMAHYNAQDEFTGCNVVNGKKYAMLKEPDYANSSTRPEWCPLLEVQTHGRLIDADKLNVYNISPVYGFSVMGVTEEDIIQAPTIILAEECET